MLASLPRVIAARHLSIADGLKVRLTVLLGSIGIVGYNKEATMSGYAIE